MVLRPPCRLDGTDAFKPRRCTLNAVLRQRRAPEVTGGGRATELWLTASGFACDCRQRELELCSTPGREGAIGQAAESA